MARVSKNARKGDKSQKFYCPCGGEVKMMGRAVKSKIQWFAYCEKCKAEKRKPSEF